MSAIPDKIVSVRMPESLVKELKALAEKNHYLDISEEIRSILRDKWMKHSDPYSDELKKIRKNLAKVTVPEKIDALKTDLKKLMEGLDDIR
ncbi:ribbon-helix-helix protein, CopG family [Candidatus Woesearchaeota archaeon]|nr:ribbon-helix-helix protein, CopG family [Candidatus Woesearchaeota archaeon]